MFLRVYFPVLLLTLFPITSYGELGDAPEAGGNAVESLLNTRCSVVNAVADTAGQVVEAADMLNIATKLVNKIKTLTNKWVPIVYPGFAMLTPELKKTLLGNDEELPPESPSDAEITERIKNEESGQSVETTTKNIFEHAADWFIDRKRRADSNLPKAFDARKAWPNCTIIGQVDDQSLCASCWAISLTHVLSDRFCIASVKAKKGPTDFFLSTTQLMTCINPNKKNGCEPGRATPAWTYILRNGVVTGGPHGNNDSCLSYPFESKGPCEAKKYFNNTKLTAPKCQRDLNKKPYCNKPYSTSFEKDKHYIEQATKLDDTTMPGNEEKIMQEIMTNGSVQASMRVYEDLIQYGSGVYVHVDGKELGGHSVRIIGWGEEQAPNNTKYWIVANSWSKDWGEKGFFRIIRGVDACTIETAGIEFAAAKLK